METEGGEGGSCAGDRCRWCLQEGHQEEHGGGDGAKSAVAMQVVKIRMNLAKVKDWVLKEVT